MRFSAFSKLVIDRFRISLVQKVSKKVTPKISAYIAKKLAMSSPDSPLNFKYESSRRSDLEYVLKRHPVSPVSGLYGSA